VCVSLGAAWLASGCLSTEASKSGSPPCVSEVSSAPPYTLSGTVRYGYVEAVPVGFYLGKLDYTTLQMRAARRVMVQALDQCGGVVVQQPTSDDGSFTLTVPGNTVSLAVAAHLKSSNYEEGGQCIGASWDVKIVDNTRSKAIWTYDSGLDFSSSSSGVVIDIPLGWNASTKKYTDRSAAPFAIADTLVSAIEKVCQGTPGTQFPAVFVNWSPNNRPTWGTKSTGDIGTSHFTIESWNGTYFPQLYILGKEGVDTDEYDDHVVAHEFGHYLESSLYRSDSVGGSHTLGDMLDPRVAFGEGYGNAFSGITFNDPIYIDSYSSWQGAGFSIRVDQPPGTDQNRGLHSETSAQYFLWQLYENRDAPLNSGSYGRIDNILRNFQKTTPALTSLLSFSSYYNAQYGDADGLSSLWTGNAVKLPYASLCVGSCSGTVGSDVADLFDLDSDIGPAMVTTRTYPYSSGNTDPNTNDPGRRPAAFWQPYKQIFAGSNAADGHDTIDAGGHSYSDWLANKLGYLRWYRYRHNLTTASPVRVTLALPAGKSCGADYVDMSVYSRGQLLGFDQGLGGCPSLQWMAEPNTDYIITVDGVDPAYGTAPAPQSAGVQGYTLTVNQ
jgi:hypothetical protein